MDRPERVENRFSLTSAEKLAARQAEAVPWQKHYWGWMSEIDFMLDHCDLICFCFWS